MYKKTWPRHGKSPLPNKSGGGHNFYQCFATSGSTLVHSWLILVALYLAINPRGIHGESSCHVSQTSLEHPQKMQWLYSRHGAEQYAGDLECVFYGYHLDRAILKIAEAAYCLMPSLLYSAWCHPYVESKYMHYPCLHWIEPTRHNQADLVARVEMQTSASVFKIILNIFFGYFDRENVFFDTENK